MGVVLDGTKVQAKKRCADVGQAPCYTIVCFGQQVLRLWRFRGLPDKELSDRSEGNVVRGNSSNQPYSTFEFLLFASSYSTGLLSPALERVKG
eukprot:scaffold337_cov172-Amphora_coffeaeformis.AAC.22